MSDTGNISGRLLAATAIAALLVGDYRVAHLTAVAEGVAVGVVSEYLPTDSRYTFKRRSGNASDAIANIPVRIGTVVMAGDQVAVPANGAITFSVADGPPRRIEGPGVFRIPVGADIGMSRRLWEAMSSMIFDVEYRSALTAISRGGSTACKPTDASLPIVVPILRAQSRIVAGVRDLPLAWSGGCAPYAIALSRGQTIVTRQENIVLPQIRLDKIALVAGATYTLTIIDSRNVQRRFDITAVAEAPTPQTDLAHDTSGLGLIARALWLADQDGGAWRLDSFEMLRPGIRQGEPLAGRIGDVLLWQDVGRLLEPLR